MITLPKPTITYKLADLLALATAQKQHHEQEVAKIIDTNTNALTHGYHSAMAEGAKRHIEKLEAFRQAGVETVTAEYQIAEGALRIHTNEDTSLGGQLHKGQIKPVL